MSSPPMSVYIQHLYAVCVTMNDTCTVHLSLLDLIVITVVGAGTNSEAPRHKIVPVSLLVLPHGQIFRPALSGKSGDRVCVFED
jgi:hypothetical protein